MSAFVVSDKLINELVNFAIVFEVNCPFRSGMGPFGKLTIEDGQLVGQDMLQANYDSVNFRYGDAEEAHEFKYEMVYHKKSLWALREELTNTKYLMQIVKWADCFDYQCCEVDKWDESMVCKFVKSIKNTAIDKVPEYESAKWCD